VNIMRGMDELRKIASVDEENGVRIGRDDLFAPADDGKKQKKKGPKGKGMDDEDVMGLEG